MCHIDRFRFKNHNSQSSHSRFNKLHSCHIAQILTITEWRWWSKTVRFFFFVQQKIIKLLCAHLFTIRCFWSSSLLYLFSFEPKKKIIIVVEWHVCFLVCVANLASLSAKLVYAQHNSENLIALNYTFFTSSFQLAQNHNVHMSIYVICGHNLMGFSSSCIYMQLNW